AFKVRTGEKVWSYPVGQQAVSSSPVVSGSFVYITHGEESEGTNNPGLILCLDASKVHDGKPTEVWRVPGIKAGLASPMVHDGRLYVCNDSAKLFCLDAATGKRIWRFDYGRVARGSPVWADGKIYLTDVNAHFHILKPGSRRCEELHDQFFRNPAGTGFIE